MRFLAAILLGCAALAYADVQKAYIDLNAVAPRFNVYEGDPSWSALAWGSFDNSVNDTGFGYLEIYTNGSYPDSYQAYAAGVLEGYLTRDMIRMHFANTFQNYCARESDYCTRLMKFLQDNLDYVNTNIEKYAMTDPYWHQIELAFDQLYGLQDAYIGAPKEAYFPVNASYQYPTPLLFLNIDGDLEDLETVLQKSKPREHLLGDGHCSALIKVLPDNSDLFTSQVTWSGYNTMLRILKKYSFQYHMTLTSPEVIPGHTATFSSAPGKLLSGDDFYVLSSGLVTQETTIGNNNDTLWKNVSPQSNLEWTRNLAANRLATDGASWCSAMERENSGTYNNQWMIVDYNKFKKGQAVQPNSGLLYILEQIPGTVTYADMSSTLATQGYWPSYNIPYFQNIYNISGWWPSVEKYGDWFTYDKSPRALIFKRNQTTVSNLDEMVKLMRYNNYKQDPLSACNCTPPYSAENAISARSDLNPAEGVYPFSALGHRAHGATDMKVTTSDLVTKLQFKAVSGPTYDQVPPFRWSTSGLNDLHQGHPDLFAFSPLIHIWGDRAAINLGERPTENNGL